MLHRLGKIPHTSRFGKNLFLTPVFHHGRHVTFPLQSLLHQPSLSSSKGTPIYSASKCTVETMPKSQDGPQTSQTGPQGDQPPAASASLSEDAWDLPLGTADQACKECRRRKAKCNRGIPTCGLCIKYNRHCLYEKHSKTPLTRKHV